MRDKKTSELMLVSAVGSEIQIAFVKDQLLEKFCIETATGHRTGHIYIGVVSRVVPSLQAAFVDYGSDKHGFLPLKEVAPEHYQTTATDAPIQDVLKEGQLLLVQIAKEERGTKGAALSTYITLAGRYIVLMPNNPKAGGVSRRIEYKEREQLKQLMAAMRYPKEMGLIIRTAGVGQTVEELQWDVDVLLRLWQAILAAKEKNKQPCLVYEESDVVVRAFRDYLKKEVSEIIIDSPTLYERAHQHLSRAHPELLSKLQCYTDKSIPLFTRYRIENQIDSAFQRDVRLPSGGFIVIQETEALVAIDVNSARDTKSSNIEKTALNTNLEAAQEVARQLRLRDLGGIIIIDFIDMREEENRMQVLSCFKEAIHSDKARIQCANQISSLGLLELSRQRLGPSLREMSQTACPRCDGLGTVHSVEFSACHLLRLIRHECANDNLVKLVVHTPVAVAIYLLNEKKAFIAAVERAQKVMISIVPQPTLETPHYTIDRIYDTQKGESETNSYSYYEKAQETRLMYAANEKTERTTETPLVQFEQPQKPDIKPAEMAEVPGFFKRLFGRFSGEHTNKKKTPSQTKPQQKNVSPNRQETRAAVEKKSAQLFEKPKKQPTTTASAHKSQLGRQRKKTQKHMGAPAHAQHSGHSVGEHDTKSKAEFSTKANKPSNESRKIEGSVAAHVKQAARDKLPQEQKPAAELRHQQRSARFSQEKNKKTAENTSYAFDAEEPPIIIELGRKDPVKATQKKKQHKTDALPASAVVKKTTAETPASAVTVHFSTESEKSANLAVRTDLSDLTIKQKEKRMEQQTVFDGPESASLSTAKGQQEKVEKQAVEVETQQTKQEKIQNQQKKAVNPQEKPQTPVQRNPAHEAHYAKEAELAQAVHQEPSQTKEQEQQTQVKEKPPIFPSVSASSVSEKPEINDKPALVSSAESSVVVSATSGAAPSVELTAEPSSQVVNTQSALGEKAKKYYQQRLNDKKKYPHKYKRKEEELCKN